MENYNYDVLSGRHIKCETVGSRDGTRRQPNKKRHPVDVAKRKYISRRSRQRTYPASYYTFEPLLGFGRSSQPLSSHRSMTVLRSLFTCNFSNIGDFLEYRKFDPWHHDDSNRYLKKQCHKDKTLCHDAEFSTDFCRLFPFQAIKIIYLDLASMDDFLRDENLGVKIVFLVRDPRGVMQSRKDLSWCKIEPNCIKSASLCSNMVADYSTAVDFSKRYPDSFKLLRYEDLVNDPWKIGKEIFSFYGIDFHEKVNRFIDTHTKISEDDDYSTSQNSKIVAFQWRDKLTFYEVNEIQKNCGDAMSIWGYNLATDSDHQKTFNPLSPLFPTNINYFQ